MFDMSAISQFKNLKKSMIYLNLYSRLIVIRTAYNPIVSGHKHIIASIAILFSHFMLIPSYCMVQMKEVLGTHNGRLFYARKHAHTLTSVTTQSNRKAS